MQIWRLFAQVLAIQAVDSLQPSAKAKTRISFRAPRRDCRFLVKMERYAVRKVSAIRTKHAGNQAPTLAGSGVPHSVRTARNRFPQDFHGADEGRALEPAQGAKR